VLEKKVSLNFTDYEFFKLMCAVERYIHLWEMVHGAKLIKEGRAARETQIASQQPHGKMNGGDDE
jgi:hypothetical protein